MGWRGLGGLLAETGGFLGYEKLKSINQMRGLDGGCS